MKTAVSRPKVLLLGATGQVGFELHRQFSLTSDVIAPSRSKLDLADLHMVERCIDDTKPDLILNAAAWTAVDRAEQEHISAGRLNTELPAVLAKKAFVNGSTLVHYSTDYVYPGNGIDRWRETDNVNPLSLYGKTKSLGDKAIEESGCNYLIFRTSWVYSARSNNFMKTMLRLAKERQNLSVIDDQIGAPTAARMISQVTFVAVQNRLESGIYNLASRGETSWHGFAEEIFAHAKRLGVGLAIHAGTVTPISSEEYKTAAVRPLNSRLSLEKIESSLGFDLPCWQSQLELTLEEYLKYEF